MDTKEILKKVRKIEVKTRRLSDHIFGGEYHSTFKGRGMTFSEVRAPIKREINVAKEVAIIARIII